jgi:protein-L-isoaspartate(D-aspartate) O-methyltransferase
MPTASSHNPPAAAEGMPMLDLAAARRQMVEAQVRTSRVVDPAIVAAMLEVPREDFVPAAYRSMAYSDRLFTLAPAGAGHPARAMLEPMVLGKLLQAAAVTPGERVLHVGCGTGYGTAILARLAHSVVAVEEDEALAAAATAALGGHAGVQIVNGPLAAGYPAGAPYDVIIVEGAVEFVPDALAAQLAPEGRLATVVGTGRSGTGTLFRRAGDDLSGFAIFGAAAPLLPGFIRPPAFVF